MFKSIRKNIRQRKLNKLSKMLLYGLITGSVTLFNGVCFADDTEDTTPPPPRASATKIRALQRKILRQPTKLRLFKT